MFIFIMAFHIIPTTSFSHYRTDRHITLSHVKLCLLRHKTYH